MRFDSLDEIQSIANHSHATLFVLPDNIEVKIKNAIIIEPTEKTTITIDQIRELLKKLATKQLRDQYIIIRPAEKLGKDAANAFLKNLEEPNSNIHFVLITSSPSEILPTILSRTALYILNTKFDLKSISIDDPKITALAKKLISAKNHELVKIAEEITAKKPNTREYTLKILGAAIEILYKSYFLTSRETFLKRLPKFLTAYENITKNGHIKLHLVADLC